jgi:hypothetical protein
MRVTSQGLTHPTRLSMLRGCCGRLGSCGFRRDGEQMCGRGWGKLQTLKSLEDGSAEQVSGLEQERRMRDVNNSRAFGLEEFITTHIKDPCTPPTSHVATDENG